MATPPETSSNFKVAVIGGGLVGSLTAVYLARRGWNVEVYELRKDLRNSPHYSGRSINLAVSRRGLAALDAVGLEAAIKHTIIPMKGRMVHTLDGKQNSQLYGVFGEHINSIDRKVINEYVLTEAEKYPNVRLFFEHDVRAIDFESNLVEFEAKDRQRVQIKADLIIGCDGAFSKVRGQMMRKTLMNYSQEYIDTHYVELHIPPTPSGDYALDPNHLHIWPRKSFMLIALPNPDKSFTSTLFMPLESFNVITTPETLVDFFRTTFPDALPLLGRDGLVKSFFENPKGALITVKCQPYNYQHKALILGDAAHAMVPFYGQGMNCGFEDILLLNEILDRQIGSEKNPTQDQMLHCLDEYSRARHPDATAICDLALYNYQEMRSSVLEWSYLLRKAVEGWIYRRLPFLGIVPLYTMVSFTRIPYSEAVRRWKRQTHWFNTIGSTTKRLGISAVSWVLGRGIQTA
ncbi:uncharacterized protein BJ171DRAFT_561484 [Polychytrium aggregatum]|uniref:uncharacterized protein n=1 Tax=Polychytrium aggregatum TaxID=110093 RepID=UPI0022FE800B|nr:uncharacterized protein BJ171DRAFT_561484 [Polychytrium aggregatum]KAI9207346.1 hypothetical protein BJ171DRAFT_561484 [Polychytrium aggregatum]